MIRIRNQLYKITFLLCWAAGSGAVFAQINMGADALGMGQAVTAQTGSTWGIFSNPALMRSDKIAVGFYSLRNYGFSELTDVAAAASLPSKYGIAGIGFHRYGDNLFNETRIRLGYAYSWKGLSAGAAVNYNSIAFGGPYGSGSAVGIDIGLAAKITEGLWLGARGTNVNKPEYRKIHEDLPRELAIGLSYRFADTALISVDVVKDVRFEQALRGGVEVKIIEDLKGRVGITTQPNTYSLGLGYGKSSWGVNVAVQRHELLGISPGMDLNLFF